MRRLRWCAGVVSGALAVAANVTAGEAADSKRVVHGSSGIVVYHLPASVLTRADLSPAALLRQSGLRQATVSDAALAAALRTAFAGATIGPVPGFDARWAFALEPGRPPSAFCNAFGTAGERDGRPLALAVRPLLDRVLRAYPELNR